ncbi:protein trichome birefringence-like 14 isoform X2 [Apium graveolens]|uniref:protein trichome birefringence-like 14 isoform X2 n=1 Tax=Apium graveolens TaxID=4045 RepID=UPI003D7BC079
MKGVRWSRFRGRQYSYTLAVLVITTVLLWSWEENPVITIVSDEGQFLKPPSECNYAKGRWIADNRRPLYSGTKCKQWLSDMWSCRLTLRKDFSYEAYRWQPEACDMPEFNGSQFLRRMQDKTVALVGDSLNRQQYQSLMCMITGGEDRPEVENVGRKYGLVVPRGAVRPDGWAYRFPDTNTTVLYYWSASLCDLEPVNMTDPATEIAMHLDRAPAFLSRYIDQIDVLVLNTGHHWNRGKLNANRWVMYVGGKPVKDRMLVQIGNAKSFAVHSIARWVDSQITLRPQLKAFFRTISPRHFYNGDWNTGGSCDNTMPMLHGSEVDQDESSDSVIESAVKSTRVKILDITALSQLRDEAHMSRYSLKTSDGVHDCLHWCLPGIPDVWNEILYAQL